MIEDEQADRSTKQSLWQSIRLSILGKYSLYLVNAISMMVLARFFSPDDFGIVAIGAVLFAFSQMLAEAGIGPSIINLRSLSPEDRNGIFSFVILVGMLAATILLLTSREIAVFFGDSRVAVTVHMMAVSILFQSAASLPVALQLRQSRFMIISAAGVAGEIISTISTILLLTNFDPVTSLSAKMPIMAFCQLCVVWWQSQSTEFGRPIPGIKVIAIQQILHSSAAQFGFNFLNFFSRNLDSILVGKFIGISALGIYDRSYQLMRYPLLLLSFALVPAIQPALRKFSGQPEEIERMNRYLTIRLALMGVVVGFIVWICADWIVWIVLGPSWTDTARILQILALSIPIQVVAATSGAFYQVMNRMGVLFLTGLVTSSLNGIGMIVGALSGSLVTLSWCIVVTFSLSFMINYFLLYTMVFQIRIWKFARTSGAVALGFVSILAALDIMTRN